MELLVLDNSLKAVAMADMFESIIWTERYSGYGEFELYTSMDYGICNEFQLGYYLWNKETTQVMIIEEIKIDADVENGSHLTIAGRSLESILERRIVWSQTVLNGNLQNAIKKLLDENIISPSDQARRVPNMIFEPSKDSRITGLIVDAQFAGDNLYDAVKKLCDAENIGFRITLSDDNQFVFGLYMGADRSYDQFENPYVIFSPKFENIINSNYLESDKTLKTVTLVAGEGEGAERKTAIVSVPTGSGFGLDRRELYTDARDISSKTADGTLSDSEYMSHLIKKGKEQLLENTVTKTFEGEIETTRMFRYGEDFYKGDIVQLANEYGNESRVRITEMVWSQGTDGTSVYPTFVNVDQE